MIYIEEKDGVLYKYKVDIDEERLKELILKIEDGNFYYNHDVEEGTLTYNDLDFTSYIDFDEDSISREKGLSYELVLYSNLYKLACRLLEYDVISKSSCDEYDRMYALYELESYSGEVDLVSLIDKEIEKRKENLYSGFQAYHSSAPHRPYCSLCHRWCTPLNICDRREAIYHYQVFSCKV